MRAYAFVTSALAALAARVRGEDPERGDVPGWVMITVMTAALVRSEEHTSELQSLAYLVCRLLHEKKKQNAKTASARPPPRLFASGSAAPVRPLALSSHTHTPARHRSLICCPRHPPSPSRRLPRLR